MFVRSALLVLVLYFVASTNIFLFTQMPVRTSHHHIIAVDNSHSMNLKQIQTKIKNIIDKIRNFDNVTLLTMSSEPQILTLRLRKNSSHILPLIQKLKLEYTNIDIATSLHLIHEQAKSRENILWIISDFRKNSWKAILKANIKLIQNRVTKWTMANIDQQTKANLALVKLESDEIIKRGKQTVIRTTIRNFDNKAHKAKISLFGGGIKKSVQFEIKAQTQKRVNFYVVFNKEGNYPIYAQLSADAVAIDNHRYLSINVYKKLKILAIDGEPGKSFSGELDYFTAALVPVDKKPFFEIDKRTLSTFRQKIDFNKYNIVVLGNVSIFPWHQQIAKLKNFVARGGLVFIGLGDKIIPKYYNDYLYDGFGLLPGKIAVKASSNAKGYQINIDRNHPIWKYFFTNRRLLTDLQKVKVQKFFSLTNQRDNVRVLARYKDVAKSPFLVEHSRGLGKVMLYTTSLDLEWNDLAGKQGHVYLIMLHELINYSMAKKQNFKVGEAFYKRFVAGINKAYLLTPQKSKIALHIMSNTYDSVSGQISAPGIYTLKLHYKNKKVNTRYLTANIDINNYTKTLDPALVLFFKQQKINYIHN